MTFNPNQYISKIQGRDYLEVKWRIAWFRDAFPGGGIQTEVISHEPLLVRAIVTNEQGAILATAHGSADDGGCNVVWKGRAAEKAETAAIGRALAHAGFGTQFIDDDESVVNSPIQRPPAAAPAAATNGETIQFTATRCDEAKSSKNTPFWRFTADDNRNAVTFTRPDFDSLGAGPWAITAAKEEKGGKVFYTITAIEPAGAGVTF